MVRRLNAEILEQAKNAKYGSERKHAKASIDAPLDNKPAGRDGVMKPLPGRKAYGYQTMVDPNTTKLWEGNPRNFERDVDITELKELLKSSGGNTEAITAMMIGDDLTVIAGRSRRQGCIEESLSLLVDVFEDLSEEECHFIADMENRGRKDLSQVAYCRYLAHRFDDLAKSPSTKISVSDFSQNYKIKRQAMQDKISVGRLPNFLFDSVTSMDSWGMRQLIAVRSLYNQIKEQGEVADSELEVALTNCKVPTAVIAELEKVLPNTKSDTSSKRSLVVGQGSVEIKTSQTGVLTIKCDNKVDVSVREKIQSYIQSLSDDKNT